MLGLENHWWCLFIVYYIPALLHLFCVCVFDGKYFHLNYTFYLVYR